MITIEIYNNGKQVELDELTINGLWEVVEQAKNLAYDAEKAVGDSPE